MQLCRYSETFEDWDCSQYGFEGVRAQDVLPLMVKQFHAAKFFGFGGFVDVLVDRGYGHGFDNEHDVRLISAVADLNEVMLDGGAIKPTMMIAHFTKTNLGDEKFYRTRSAAQSIRIPD